MVETSEILLHRVGKVLNFEAIVAVAQTSSEISLTDTLGIILSNEKILISVLIQFLMGLGVGYYFAKAVKYLIAFVLVLVIGGLLNVWSFSGSVDDIFTKYATQLLEYKDEIFTIMKIFGAILVGPTLLGFMIGIVIGLTKK